MWEEVPEELYNHSNDGIDEDLYISDYAEIF